MSEGGKERGEKENTNYQISEWGHHYINYRY